MLNNPQQLLQILVEIQNFLSNYFPDKNYYYELNSKLKKHYFKIEGKHNLVTIAESNLLSEQLHQTNIKLKLYNRYQSQTICCPKVHRYVLNLLDQDHANIWTEIHNLCYQNRLAINSNYYQPINNGRANIQCNSIYNLDILSSSDCGERNQLNHLPIIQNQTLNNLHLTIYLVINIAPKLKRKIFSNTIKNQVDPYSSNHNNLQIVILFFSSSFSLPFKCQAIHQRFAHNLNRLILPFPTTEKLSMLYGRILKHIDQHLQDKAIIKTQIVNDINYFFESKINLLSPQSSNTKSINLITATLNQANLFKPQLQQNLKTTKQLIKESKENLTNPFLSYSISYQLQSAIQNFKVQSYVNSQRRYLRLVNAKNNPNIHLQLIDLIYVILNDWLSEQKKLIHQIYQPQFYQYQQLQSILIKLDLKIDLFNTSALPILPKLELDSLYEPIIVKSLNELDCGKTRKNQLVYRFIIVASISLVFYYSTGLIIGFMPLLIQALNLILSRETHRVKIEQKTETLKKNLEQKYQHLARLAVHQVHQQLLQTIEHQHQQYEHNIEQLKLELNQKLQTYKKTEQERNLYSKAYNNIKNRYLPKIINL